MSTNPYMQGMKAANDGALPNTNPYAKGTTRWTQWRAGYLAAKKTQAERQEREALTLARAWAQ